MHRFAAAGLECHAISLRGTSASPCDARSVKISEHVDDLRCFVEEALDRTPPILVGHSFGGASVLKYLEAGHPASGAVLLCSVPPSGNSAMTLRFLRRSLRQAFAITRGFALKTAATNLNDCRALFFDERSSDAELSAFLPRLEADSQVGLDLRYFNANLPSAAATPDSRAAWLPSAPPCLVIGAERDAVVDVVGVEETAHFLGIDGAELFDLPHDVMLCHGWEAPADRVIEWSRALSL